MQVIVEDDPSDGSKTIVLRFHATEMLCIEPGRLARVFAYLEESIKETKSTLEGRREEEKGAK